MIESKVLDPFNSALSIDIYNGLVSDLPMIDELKGSYNQEVDHEKEQWRFR